MVASAIGIGYRGPTHDLLLVWMVVSSMPKISRRAAKDGSRSSWVKSMPSDGESKCLAFVQTYDQKPKRRFFELLRSQNMQMNQQVTFLTDGGEDIRELPQFINPEAEHILDWFHIAMRLTVMGQTAKGPALVTIWHGSEICAGTAAIRSVEVHHSDRATAAIRVLRALRVEAAILKNQEPLTGLIHDRCCT
jgi:hypothetical protein